MVAMESTSCNEDDLKSQKKLKMDTTILDCFTKLVADNERIRLDGELSLLKHLGQQKVCVYMLLTSNFSNNTHDYL